jgi:AcrR family transcriptional regulator
MATEKHIRNKGKSATRELILSVAMNLFSEKSFDRTTTEEIAASADISKGLIYNYFKTKEEIFLTLLERANEGMEAMLAEISLTDSLEDQFRMLVNLWLKSFQEHSQLWRMIFQSHLQPNMIKMLYPGNLTAGADLNRFVLRLMAEFNSSDPLMDAMMLGALMDGIGLNYTSAPEHFPLELFGKRICSRFFCELKQESSQRHKSRSHVKRKKK